jgi:Fe-S-cluster containining protein
VRKTSKSEDKGRRGEDLCPFVDPERKRCEIAQRQAREVYCDGVWFQTCEHYIRGRKLRP